LRRGGENSTDGDDSVLKESSGEGAQGWAPCGGRVGEREGEGGPRRGGDSAAVQRWAAAAQPRRARAAVLRA
jgi:hypothetical protein